MLLIHKTLGGIMMDFLPISIDLNIIAELPRNANKMRAIIILPLERFHSLAAFSNRGDDEDGDE